MTDTPAPEYLDGQTWDHNGFTIRAELDTTGEVPEMRLRAEESAASLDAHSRQFRYTRTFVTLEEATAAVDAAQIGYESRPDFVVPDDLKAALDKHASETNSTISIMAAPLTAPAKVSHGYDDAGMSAQGWERLPTSVG